MVFGAHALCASWVREAGTLVRRVARPEALESGAATLRLTLGGVPKRTQAIPRRFVTLRIECAHTSLARGNIAAGIVVCNAARLLRQRHTPTRGIARRLPCALRAALVPQGVAAERVASYSAADPDTQNPLAPHSNHRDQAEDSRTQKSSGAHERSHTWSPATEQQWGSKPYTQVSHAGSAQRGLPCGAQQRGEQASGQRTMD
jgi:hypothetical protein